MFTFYAQIRISIARNFLKRLLKKKSPLSEKEIARLKILDEKVEKAMNRLKYIKSLIDRARNRIL